MQHLPLVEPGFLQRLFGQKPKQNAFWELHNRLCEASGPSDLSSSTVQEIADRWGADPRDRYSHQVQSLFSDFVRESLPRAAEEPLDRAGLEHLALVLRIPEPDARRLIEGAVLDRYRKAAETIPLKSDARSKLRALAEHLQVPEDLEAETFREVGTARLKAMLERFAEDQRYTPDEEQELEETAGALGVKLELEPETERYLARLRRYWEIEQGDLPVVEPGIHLQKNETAHTIRDVVWYEHRTVTTRYQYSGPTARLRLAKGIYWRVGDVALRPVSHDELREIDRGRLYLTNKRILFQGQRKNTNIRLNRIIDFQPYSDGVDVQKDAGKSPFLEFHDDVDFFCIILDRLLREARS